MVHIEVNNGYSAYSVFFKRIRYSYRQIVEKTKSQRLVRTGVMSRWTDRAKGCLRLAAHNCVNGSDACTRRSVGSLKGMAIHNCVGVKLDVPALRGPRPEVSQIFGRMNAQQIMIGSRDCRHGPQPLHRSIGDQLIVNGIKPTRAFGMPVSHFVQTACRVGNIKRFHKG